MILIPKRNRSLYDELADAGVLLSVGKGGRLIVDAPQGYLTPELVRRIKREKLSLIAELMCDRCGSTEFTDTEIHNGESLRRDCRHCRLTWGFPVWHGRSVSDRSDN